MSSFLLELMFNYLWLQECIREHEKQMELSFAIQRSIDKTCGICMDTVMEKEPQTERRFGILEKCSHIFCLTCIRKWRQTKQFDNKTIRSCPECRVSSDFVVPSKYWVEENEDKTKLIDSYKIALRQKPCKYFKQGAGECPFAGACFYLHAYPDGTKAELPPPRRRLRRNEDGDLEALRVSFCINNVKLAHRLITGPASLRLSWGEGWPLVEFPGSGWHAGHAWFWPLLWYGRRLGIQRLNAGSHT